MDFIVFHHENKEQYIAIIELARKIGIKLTKNINDKKKLKKFPYIYIDKKRNSLGFIDMTLIECDKYGNNRKDFLGMIRFLLQINDKVIVE